MKTICVPVSVEAMTRLDTDSCQPGNLREVELDAAEFRGLEVSGFFRELNSQLRLLIEEFEDEMIPPELVGRALELLQRTAQRSGVEPSKLTAIEALFRLAIQKSTGVFLFF